MTNDWETRPLDHRHLLNPAFCGMLLTKATKEYVDLAGHGMPLSLMFLLLPLAVPSQVRAVLPTNSVSSFPAWVTNIQRYVWGWQITRENWWT